jgi:hypothetical protein
MTVKRRDLVVGGAGVVAGVAAVGLSAQAEAPKKQSDIDWNREADVQVSGSAGTGHSRLALPHIGSMSIEPYRTGKAGRPVRVLCAMCPATSAMSSSSRLPSGCLRRPMASLGRRSSLRQRQTSSAPSLSAGCRRIRTTAQRSLSPSLIDSYAATELLGGQLSN